MWGGFALWQYVQNFVHWYDAYFLIPGVLVWVGLAKLQQRLPWGVYLSIVLNIAVVIWASQWVMVQHVVEADPKSNGERLKFNMHEWLSGRGWPGKAVPSAGSGGGAGVGGFVMLFPNGEPTLEWIFYWSWGIPLLASALAVPAWRMFQPKGGRRRENGRSARLNVVTPPHHGEF